MGNNIINDIVWYIPFKKLRNALREYLFKVLNLKEEIIKEVLNLKEEIIKLRGETNKMVISEENLNPIYLLRKKAAYETVNYILEKANNANLFNDRFHLLNYVMNTYFLNKDNQNKLFLEFGVFQGSTINFCSSILKDATFYGFDCFEGLPETWSGWIYEESAFNLDGVMPKVNNNVKLIKGYFDETLPTFLKQNNNKAAFIHVDCDLYSSTKTIFDNLYDRITKDTIIVFDEYYNYNNWKEHEYKAFQEFCKKYDVSYEYVGLSIEQVAVKITDIKN